MILVIDNYDSFTYNLVQYLHMLDLPMKDKNILVKRNNEITIEEITQLSPQAIVISPGPGRPDDAGISLAIIQHFSRTTPILGICLGHQTIAQAFGGKIITSDQPVHGKVFPITHTGKGLFHGLPSPLKVTRYHSLVVDKISLPPDLCITACIVDDDPTKQYIMAIKHKVYPVEGIQFHPEALLTEYGLNMLDHFFTRYISNI